MTDPASRTHGLLRSRWAGLVVALSIVPIAGLFTLSRIFFVRDLSFFFWSRHLWFRRTVFSGSFPLWDPYVAAGQSAIADALNQLVMPITALIRLLPSEVVSFNLWVALPLPIASLGMFAFLRRTHRDAASATGAIAFGLSGPIVSMLNAPNLSWSVAAMPLVLLAADRLIDSPSMRRLATLAVAVALQALCGEPVTLASTAVVAVAYAAWRGWQIAGSKDPAYVENAGSKDPAYVENAGSKDPAYVEKGGSKDSGYTSKDAADTRQVRSHVGRVFRPGMTAAAWVVAGLLLGALLAAVQLWPTMMAGVQAHRGNMATPDFWSLHPLGALEVVAPHLFGNYYDAFLADMPWMAPFNSGREPFYYSIYVGPLVLALAATGLVARPRRNVVWALLAVLFFLAAMGGYTPFYPLVRRLLSPLTYFRFPVKYLVVTTFAVAVLAADGWAALADAGKRRRIKFVALGCVVLAMAIGVAIALPIVAAARAERAVAALATRVHVEPVTGTPFLLRVAPPLAARVAAMLLAAATLLAIAISSGSRAHAAAYLLLAAMCADLVVTNADLNLTMDLAKLTPPQWYTALAGDSRLYIGGRVRGFMNAEDPDASKKWEIPAEPTAIEGRMELNAELPMAPSGWQVREALSYDLPVLWPAEYEGLVRRFERATAGERELFLRRSGVRWCVLPDAARPWLHTIASVPHWSMRLVDCDPDATRVFIASKAKTGEDPAWQQRALFDATVPDDDLRVPFVPAAAGIAGAPVPPFARFVEDGENRVVLEAGLERDGFLVLRDSYDPSWRVEVDGAAAEMTRANGMYRAVHLAPGRHVIRFRFRPRDLFTGLTITTVTALLLMAMSVWRAPRRRLPPEGGSYRSSEGSGRLEAPRLPTSGGGDAQQGFTLIELMIVLAIIGIVLAIAFATYRNMHARGNEASAIASLRSIAAAQWQFAQTCGSQKYAASLPALGQPVPQSGEAFLSPDLTSADQFEKSGYLFAMTAKPVDGAAPACNGTAVAEGYAVTADPATPGISGERFFAINADRVLYEDAETYLEKMPETGNPGKGTEIK